MKMRSNNVKAISPSPRQIVATAGRIQTATDLDFSSSGEMFQKKKGFRQDFFTLSYNNNQVPDPIAWWHHQMETFSPLLALCAENSPVTGESPSQRPVTRSFDIFFDLPEQTVE